MRGDPDCAAFYQWIHTELTKVTMQWPPTVTKLTTGRKGNLGEFVSYHVARANGLYGKEKGYTVALMGALTPLQNGAPTGLDITILHLDPAGDVTNDCLYIMEVKTTGKLELTYAKALINDYEKLLGTATVAGSLGQRFNWLQSYLRELHQFSDDALERVGNLFMPEAKDCQSIRLLPTLVHDRNAGDSVAVIALDDVAAEVEKQGWGKSTIEPWSIAISKLTECLIHLSNNGVKMP
jgi:hypothetical protein